MGAALSLWCHPSPLSPLTRRRRLLGTACASPQPRPGSGAPACAPYGSATLLFEKPPPPLVSQPPSGTASRPTAAGSSFCPWSRAASPCRRRGPMPPAAPSRTLVSPTRPARPGLCRRHPCAATRARPSRSPLRRLPALRARAPPAPVSPVRRRQLLPARPGASAATGPPPARPRPAPPFACL